MDLGEVNEDLARFEGGEGFPGTGGVPDVAVFAAILYAVHDGLHGIVLVGAEDHKDFVNLVEDHVLSHHLAHVARFEELAGKVRELSNGIIVDVGPVEGLLEGLVTVVGVVLGVDAIADDEHLYEEIETAGSPEGVPLIAVDLVEGLLELQAAPLEFDLDEGDSVYQERNVVAVFIRSLNGHLAGDLKLILTPLFLL